MKRSKYILIALLVTTLSVDTQAQNAPIGGTQRVELLNAIAAAQKPKAGTKLTKHFVQTKHTPMLATDAVSKGIVTIDDGRNLRWHYTEPDDMALVIEGDSIYTVSHGQRRSLDGAAGRITRGMAQMMSTLTSGNGLTDEKQFEITLTNEGSKLKAVLVPKRRDMRRMMQRVELEFDPKNYEVRSVRIVEREDSYTTIVFDKR